jgi:hypothetical protein
MTPNPTTGQPRAKLSAVVASIPERAENVKRTGARARQVSERLPLVHRTGHEKATRSWTAIFAEGRIEPSAVKSGSHEEVAGWSKIACFFLGSGAYPHGNVALVLSHDLARTADMTFSPFDSGALGRYLLPAGIDPDGWAVGDRAAFLVQYTGHGRELDEFVPDFLGAHFLDPIQYVRLAQHTSPDWDPFHELRSRDRDRRAWTIEVQSHKTMDLAAESQPLRRIVVDGLDLLEELPATYRRLSMVAPAGDFLGAITDVVEHYVESRA